MLQPGCGAGPLAITNPDFGSLLGEHMGLREEIGAALSPWSLCPKLCSATAQHCRVGLGAGAQGIQLPKVKGSSGCGTSALRPWGSPRTPRAGLCCGSPVSGKHHQLGMGTGQGFGPTGCFMGSCCPLSTASPGSHQHGARLLEHRCQPWSRCRLAMPADFWAVCIG